MLIFLKKTQGFKNMSHYFFSLKSEMELRNLMHTKKPGDICSILDNSKKHLWFE